MKAAHNLTFEAIGTHWVIDIDQTISMDELREVEQAINERIATFDKTYSRFRQDSLVAEISRRAGTYELPDDAEKLLNFYKHLYDVSGGKVTPLIGNLMADAGYDATYSFEPGKLTPPPTWEAALSYEHPRLKTEQPVLLDVGAAGKGYLVDIVGELLATRGITSYLIDAGGDMLRKTNSGDVVRVGLEHPGDPSQAIGIALLGNGSICGSAGNRRKWADMHHIMDPDLARPTNKVLATWVMADSALVADGVATALFFTEPRVLQKQFSFEYCLVRPDYSFDHSAHFPAELFTGATP